jgi:AcrR family transcriptional regulator
LPANSEASEERLRRRRSSRQEEILRAAGRELLKAGYSGASLDNIAEAVHVSKGTLYHYFPTKEALYEAWMEMVHKGAMARILPAFELDASPVERLREMIVAEALIFTADLPDYARVFLRGMDWPRDLNVIIREQQAELGDLFRQVIAEGVEAGDLKVANETVARHCVQGCLAYIPEWFRPEGSLNPREVSDAVAAMVMGLLGVPMP